MIPIADSIRQFADHVEKYLAANKAYRDAGIKNPARRKELEAIRNAAYRVAQTANVNLHLLLSRYPDPDILRDHARELIRAWDKRGTCWQNLKKVAPDDHPYEARKRLDRAERELRAQLQKVQDTLKALSTN